MIYFYWCGNRKIKSFGGNLLGETPYFISTPFFFTGQQ